MKTCIKRKLEKPLSDFGKNSSTKDGIHYYCRECAKTFRTKDKTWRNHLKFRYGITVDEYNSLAEATGGVCCICENPFTEGRRSERGMNLDHCHDTGRVRGIICAKCNVSLGAFDHSTRVLENAVAYLSGR